MSSFEEIKRDIKHCLTEKIKRKKDGKTERKTDTKGRGCWFYDPCSVIHLHLSLSNVSVQFGRKKCRMKQKKAKKS